jgi:V8-like Glu-specific endopeptidase
MLNEMYRRFAFTLFVSITCFAKFGVLAANQGQPSSEPPPELMTEPSIAQERNIEPLSIPEASLVPRNEIRDGAFPIERNQVAPRASTPGIGIDASPLPQANGGGEHFFSAGQPIAGGSSFSSSRLIPRNARLEYPYRPVGVVILRKRGARKDTWCSGAVIAPRIVLTAGHCVHDGGGENSNWYAVKEFIPAFEAGNNSSPFGRWRVRSIWVTWSWFRGPRKFPHPGDIALLIIEDQQERGINKRIGEVTGTLGYRIHGLHDNHVKIIGYPKNLDDADIIHQVDANSFSAHPEEPLTVLYGSDMLGGSSGSPMIENFGQKAVGQTGGFYAYSNHVVGVVSYEVTGRMLQGGVTLGREFSDLIKELCLQDVRNCNL